MPRLSFFCSLLSVFYSYRILAWKERVREIYIHYSPSRSSYVPRTYMFNSYLNLTGLFPGKKRADYLPGCLKPEVLYCCNQVFQYDTGVSNRQNRTQSNPSELSSISLHRTTNMYRAGGGYESSTLKEISHS